jgi:hypothetical protein
MHLGRVELAQNPLYNNVDVVNLKMKIVFPRRGLSRDSARAAEKSTSRSISQMEVGPAD